MVFWNRKTNERELMKKELLEIEKMERRIIDMDAKINGIIANAPAVLKSDEMARLVDLEVKMAKLWSLLIELTPKGQEKINKTGKRIYGGRLN